MRNPKDVLKKGLCLEVASAVPDVGGGSEARGHCGEGEGPGAQDEDEVLDQRGRRALPHALWHYVQIVLVPVAPPQAPGRQVDVMLQ